MPADLKNVRAVLFDYGETLAHEDGFDPKNGFAALLEHAAANPMQADATTLLSAFGDCYYQLRLDAHEAGAELPNLLRWKWLFEMHELEFHLNPVQIETIFWDAAAPCVPTPSMPELLALLRKKGVRSGVVSNMGFSGQCLKHRLQHLFPDHHFDFVMTSADYLIRKPDPHLFALALKKARCRADEALFCGDNPGMDILGAHRAGITPVFYDRDLGCAYRKPTYLDQMPPCIRISDWSQLHEALQA